MKLEKRIDIWIQQAVEKILKALYIKSTGKEPPYIHALEDLVEKVNLQNELADLIVELDDYYFLIRYPGFGDEVPYQQCTEEDARDGLEKAKKILDIVQQKLKMNKKEEDKNG